MNPNYLFRGDCRDNGEVIKHFRMAGLHTRLINGGNPQYVTEVGLLEAIRVHIAPQISERDLQQKSHFISFTSNREKALFYASSGESEKLVECKSYTESRYIFSFDTSQSVIVNEDVGIYTLSYESQPTAIEPDSQSFNDLILFVAFKNELQKKGTTKHTLCLLDVVTYLKAYPQYQTSPEALKNAERDSEWLVLPTDHIEGLVGYSANIPRSSLWSYQCLRLTSESSRDPNETVNLGLDVDDNGS